MGIVAHRDSLLRWHNSSEADQKTRGGASSPRIVRTLRSTFTRTSRPTFSSTVNIVGSSGSVGREKRKQSTYIQQGVAAQIGIEDVLIAFGKAARYIARPEHKDTEKPVWRESKRPTVIGSHAEVWMNDPESKLCGRADHIEFGEIIDFKSGDQEADDTNQILFYAALYLAFTDETPRALRLIYAASDAIVNVPVPGSTALRQCLAEMRQRALTADRRILESDLPAKPEPLKCARCNVRALCDKYWESQHLFEAETTTQSKIVDYAPSGDARVEMAAHGAYLRDRFGSRATSLYIPNDVLVKAGSRPEPVRVLSVRAASENEIVRLGFTQYSEFYAFEFARQIELFGVHPKLQGLD